LTPTLLSQENLYAGGVFKNGAHQLFLLFKASVPANAHTNHGFLPLSQELFPKSNPTMKYPG
jgi:hypothetical protein